MRIDSFLDITTKRLKAAGIETPRLDTLVILEDVIKVDRAKLLAEPSMHLSATQLSKLEKLFKRRMQHEPLAYLRGRTEFYGREFLVSPAVLVPRPESETMIDLLKCLPVLSKGEYLSPNDRNLRRRLSVADVGSGSGVLGITAMLEVPELQVELLEIDPEAMKIATLNVDIFTLSIKTTLSDMLSNTGNTYDVLLCNLPYVPDRYELNKAAHYEPNKAIFGGEDGLNLYRQLFLQISNLSSVPLYILTESMPDQHAALRDIAKQNGFNIIQTVDYIQVFSTAE